MNKLAWVILALILCGCDQGLDRDQARFCRLVAVALAGPEARLQIRDQRLLTSSPDRAVLHVDYVDAGGPAPGRAGFVDCAFGTGSERLDLQGARSQDGIVSEPRLFVLNRFWLHSDESLGLDPLPISGSDTAVRLPSGTGYAIQQLINAVPSAAIYGLLAAAYSLVYGLVGRINLAFGSFAAIGGVAALLVVLGTHGWPVAGTLGAALAIGWAATALHGMVAGRLVFKPLHGASGQQGLVATIGLALFLGEYLRLTQGAEAQWAEPLLDSPIAIARDPSFVVTVTPIALLAGALAAGTAAALLWCMTHTRFGLHWRAFADDPRAAALFGVGRDQIFARTFAIASGLAGMAGAITLVFFGDLGGGYATVLGLKALTAAVLGGIGSVPGAFLGGIFLGLMESAWSASFPIASRDLVVYCILVGTLIWRPGGFLGYRDLTPRRV
jgi:branched-subunit amino acid ABC-type transport system permease component